MPKENIYNIPNLLSAYRILALPVIAWALIAGERNLFVTLIIINLITDILDGVIARTFKLETEFGARLDSIADIGTYIMGCIGLVILEKAFVTQYRFILLPVIFLYFIPEIIALLKFRRLPSLHLYSSKIVAYLQGIFLFTFFLFGFSKWYFYFMIVCSCLSYLEASIIILLLPYLKSNVQGIYFLNRHKQEVRS